MSKNHSSTIRILSIITLAAFIATQAGPAYALRSESADESDIAHAIGAAMATGSVARADGKAVGMTPSQMLERIKDMVNHFKILYKPDFVEIFFIYLTGDKIKPECVYIEGEEDINEEGFYYRLENDSTAAKKFVSFDEICYLGTKEDVDFAAERMRIYSRSNNIKELAGYKSADPAVYEFLNMLRELHRYWQEYAALSPDNKEERSVISSKVAGILQGDNRLAPDEIPWIDNYREDILRAGLLDLNYDRSFEESASYVEILDFLERWVASRTEGTDEWKNDQVRRSVIEILRQYDIQVENAMKEIDGELRPESVNPKLIMCLDKIAAILGFPGNRDRAISYLREMSESNRWERARDAYISLIFKFNVGRIFMFDYNDTDLQTVAVVRYIGAQVRNFSPAPSAGAKADAKGGRTTTLTELSVIGFIKSNMARDRGYSDHSVLGLEMRFPRQVGKIREAIREGFIFVGRGLPEAISDAGFSPAVRRPLISREEGFLRGIAYKLGYPVGKPGDCYIGNIAANLRHANEPAVLSEIIWDYTQRQLGLVYRYPGDNDRSGRAIAIILHFPLNKWSYRPSTRKPITGEQYPEGFKQFATLKSAERVFKQMQAAASARVLVVGADETIPISQIKEFLIDGMDFADFDNEKGIGVEMRQSITDEELTAALKIYNVIIRETPQGYVVMSANSTSLPIVASSMSELEEPLREAIESI